MSDSQVCAHLNRQKLTVEDICRVEQFCYAQIEKCNLYALRNDAKLRAVSTTRTYEEFKDIVDAAALIPLSKTDKTNSRTKKRLWNATID